jgi:two-component system invasion response regulator UvrY
MSKAQAARLLLVDDHAIVRAGYRHLLEQQRFTVVAEAATADEAYGMFRQHRPDIVITDLALPGASGVDAIQRIVRADAAARVLVFLRPAAESARDLPVLRGAGHCEYRGDSRRASAESPRA